MVLFVDHDCTLSTDTDKKDAIRYHKKKRWKKNFHIALCARYEKSIYQYKYLSSLITSMMTGWKEIENNEIYFPFIFYQFADSRHLSRKHGKYCVISTRPSVYRSMPVNKIFPTS